jgi:hypothetical protein
MTKLFITKLVRTSGEIEIILDGQKLGVVADSATAEFDIPAGEHQLQAKLKWMGVTEFSFHASDNSSTILHIKDNQRLHFFPIIYLGIIMLYLNLYKEYTYQIPVYLLVIPIAFYYLYFFTLGSHKRMVIKGIN